MQIIGNYLLRMEIGGIEVNIPPHMISYIAITQDISRFLPTFKMIIKDATGLLGEILPFDKKSNEITLEIARSNTPADLNTFKFVVKKRIPTLDKTYDVEGILNIKNLITTSRTRAIVGNIKTNIEDIVKDELEIEDTEIGTSLSYDKTLLQTGVTNARFLDYLKNNLIGKNEESCYFCFVKNKKGVPVFVFKSIDELFLSPGQYKFIVGHRPYEDFYPIVDWQVFDNSSFMSDFGSSVQEYSYFDYENGRYISSTADMEDCPSLCETFLVDNDKDTQITKFVKLGRSNDFTLDFKGRMKNDFFGRVTEFIHMWASTWGLENICPGDIVQVIFADALNQGQLFAYQHSGFWMVKRVVHIIGSTFVTNLLLTRSGIDTSLSTTLRVAEKQVKK